MSYSQKVIFIMVPVWHYEFLNFCHVSVVCVKICICIPNFNKFRWFVAEIWRYNDFQNGGHPPVGFPKLDISSPNLRMHAIMPPCSKVYLNWTIWSRVIAKKMIFSMASIRHLEFVNFCHLSIAWVKIYNDFRNGAFRHIGFIVTSSYIVQEDLSLMLFWKKYG